MYELIVTYQNVMDLLCKNHTQTDKHAVKDAYEYAARLHDGVFRKTGEPYIYHPLRVAKFVADWGFESDVVIAALLHDVVEDCGIPISEIEARYGSVIATAVDAVSALSDKDFEGMELSKRAKDILSDAKLQRKMNNKALYVKIADRIDNLSTIEGMSKDKQLAKAAHTREIIIPMAKIANAYYFVDVLEELCFKIEHADTYARISERYRKIRNINANKCHSTLDMFSSLFDSENKLVSNELETSQKYIINFFYNHRSRISIFRQISKDAENLKKDFDSLLTKRNIAMYDMTLIVSNELADPASTIKPYDIFYNYYESILMSKGISILKYCSTTYNDSRYLLLTDEMDNLYRLFIRTEDEYKRFLYGDIIDENYIFAMDEVNEDSPADSSNEKIKVFRRDGSAMKIDKGATVLDFAFHIHSELGLHFEYAMVDESKTQLPPYRKLNDGDTITIVNNPDITPNLSWFNYVKTSKAVKYLVKYFQASM